MRGYFLFYLIPFFVGNIHLEIRDVLDFHHFVLGVFPEAMNLLIYERLENTGNCAPAMSLTLSFSFPVALIVALRIWSIFSSSN